MDIRGIQRRASSRATFALTGVLLVAGCGTRAGGDAPADDPAALTSRAVAAVMLDHLPSDTSTRQATFVDEHSPAGLVGADFRYGAGEADDGSLVQVTVSRGTPATCERGDERCVELPGDVLLGWDTEAPVEDPGTVGVQHVAGEDVVLVSMAGPVITGDPREMDLSPSVEELVALATDERLRLTTTAAVVAAAEDLDDWDGGERDTGELDEVPHNDRTLVMGWLSAYGDGLRYLGPSPVKDVLGEGAIGGRVHVTRDFLPVGPGTVDALAAPAPPAWLGSGCLEGYRCQRLAGVHFVWRSAEGDDPGDAYALVVRDTGETVGFHTVGRPLPPRARAAAGRAGVFMWGPDLTDPDYSPGAPSLTTTRERFDQYDR